MISGYLFAKQDSCVRDVSNLTHQVTSRAVDRMMYAYTDDVRSNFLISSSSGSVCL